MSMGPWESGFQLFRYFRISSSVGVGIQSKVPLKTGDAKQRQARASYPVRRLRIPPRVCPNECLREPSKTSQHTFSTLRLLTLKNQRIFSVCETRLGGMKRA